MSSKSTVVWLLVAVVLGVAAVLILRNPGTGGGPAGSTPAIGDRVMHVDPARMDSVLIAHADGSSELLQRSVSGPAEWVMQVVPAGQAAGDAASRPAWPVPTSRVQALVRQMNEVQVRASAGEETSLGSGPTSVTISLEDSGPIVVELGEQSVAGKALVEVTESEDGKAGAVHGPRLKTVRAIVDDTVHLLFRDNAPREWRDRTALFGAGLDASRVRLENNKGTTLALGKVQGDWSVREPWSAPADPAAVQRLLAAVTSIQIVDFLDQGVPSATTQLDKPAATLTLETDRHGTGDKGAAAVDTRTLAIGGAADSAGTRLFARIDGERTVVIDARAVADLKLDPALYAWPFPTRLNSADIGTIAIERTSPHAAVPGCVYRREMDRWKQVRLDGREVLLPDADTRPVIAMLGFICGPATGTTSTQSPSPAAGTPSLGPIAITGEAPEGLVSLGRIKILSLSGAPLDTLEVGQSKPGTITVRTNSVYRTFALDRVPSLIGEFAQSTPPPAPKDASGLEK